MSVPTLSSWRRAKVEINVAIADSMHAQLEPFRSPKADFRGQLLAGTIAYSNDMF